MPSAREAREWVASGGLRGIGDSLYTPFSGRDGDDIDWDAYRTLVRYCVGDLGHAMLWLTSGIGEWWSLTMDERKKLLRGGGRRGAGGGAGDGDPGVHERGLGQRRRRAHAPRPGARRRHLLPADAADGGPRRRGRAALLPVHRRSHRHRARHVQLALVGLRAHRARRWPRSTTRSPPWSPSRKGVQDSISRTAALHALAPELVIWECDLIVYRAGWLQEGIVGPAQLGTAGLPLRDAGQPRVHAVLGADLGRQARRGVGVRQGVGARRLQRRHRVVAGSPSTPAGPTTSPTGARPSSTPPR